MWIPPAAGADACQGLRGRTVRWIVPHQAGGGHDTYARLIAPHWETALGVQVVVENEYAAGGLVGIARIHDARPDGLTLGLVNGPGLLAAALMAENETPSLLDLTPLGQVARVHHVWLVSADSPLHTLEDVLRVGRRRSILFGLRDVGASSLVDSVGGAEILGLPFELVAGYDGTAGRLLALQRGEIDLITLSFEAGLSALEGGRVRPILQLFDGPISDHASLAGVPWLGGDEGVALTKARVEGADLEKVAADTEALLDLMTLGRLVVAPPGLPSELFDCLEERLADVLSDPELRQQATRAGLSWEPGRARAVRRELKSSPERAAWLVPVMEAAVAAMRE